MADLGQAYVQIVPSAKGIKANLERELSGSGIGAAGEAAGHDLGGQLLGGLKKVFSAAIVAKTVKDTFSAAGALEQSFGGLETVYGEAMETIGSYALNAAQAGISANDFAEQAVSFGNALKQAYGGDVVAAAEAANSAIMDMADNSAKYGTSLEELKEAYKGFARGNYRMLDNLSLGYQEGDDEMKRLLADAEKLSGIHYDISNLGDVYSAIHVIQTELGIAGVAADEAKTTLSGSFNAMKASWENMQAALLTGEGFTVGMENLSESIKNFVNNVFSMLGTLAPRIPDFLGGIAEAIIDGAPELLVGGVEMAAQLAIGLVEGIPKLLDKMPELFSRTAEAFSAVDWDSLGRDLISGIIRGLDSAVTNLYYTLRNMALNALQSAKNALGIGSPSRVFADEVGRWIPAGAAEGIENNMNPLESAVYDMAMSGALAFGNDGKYAAEPVSVMGGFDYSRLAREIAGAVSTRPVVIQGDTSRIFKVVQRENRTRTVATNYNILAAPARG